MLKLDYKSYAVALGCPAEDILYNWKETSTKEIWEQTCLDRKPTSRKEYLKDSLSNKIVALNTMVTPIYKYNSIKYIAINSTEIESKEVKEEAIKLPLVLIYFFLVE